MTNHQRIRPGQRKVGSARRLPYDDIVEACKLAWLFLINDPERIRSIGSRDWACVIV
jgi:hypothetical protein